MSTGGGDFERALGGLLTLDVTQIRHGRIAGVRRRLRALERLEAFEVIDELKQIARREDCHVGRAQAASAPELARADQPLPSAFAPIAAGSAPAIGAIEPSSASSPSTQ